MMQLWLICLSALFIGVSGGCSRMETCSSDFKNGLEMAGIREPESSPEYCAELRAYAQCIKKVPKACRGDLSFHTATSLIDTLLNRYRCQQIPFNKRPSPVPHKPQNRCVFAAKSHPPRYEHCGLFGDPHLKTFSRVYQTCSTKGAWPLIDNKYLAVQATNRPVLNSSEATATTKITIIIRGYSACGEEKMYEATSDTPLKPYFTDETHQAGPDGAIRLSLTTLENSERVEIYVRYIDTTLIIRRVGEYLGFSCKVPEEIVKISDENVRELCRSGCPTTEVLDIASSAGYHISWQSALHICQENSDLNIAIRNNLTDQYLDWCVFDIMTTGRADFVSAAHSAQADVLLLDPGSLHNRTEPLQLNRMPFSSTANRPCFSIFMFILLLFHAYYSR